jgi:hypothetical protein
MHEPTASFNRSTNQGAPMKPIRVVAAALFVVSLSAYAQGKAEEGKGGHHGPPPQEALKACEGKSAEATCSFTHDGKTVNGTCFTPGSGKPLACRPVGSPPQGR